MSERNATDLRMRQRDLLADLGTEALRSSDLDRLLDAACPLVAEGMDVSFCKVLELLPGKQRLLVRAGIGWHEGVVGHAELGADDESPAGHALRTNAPVISNDLARETRFRTPRLLIEHGIRRAMNVAICVDDEPFGVLEVDSHHLGGFSDGDISFLRAAANLLGMAIARGRREAELREIVRHREILVREADHRIKNSLQLVISLLSLQRSRLKYPQAVAALDDAIARVFAIAESHRALHESADLSTVTLGRMLADLCEHVGHLSATVAVGCSCEAGIELDAERAIPLGLIVSELLTNAFRHAYPDGKPGMVRLRAETSGEFIEVTVRDDGVGMEKGAAGRPGSLGTTIIRALVQQIKAEFSVATAPGEGTQATLRLRREVGQPAAEKN
ncbi:MAG: histidine kinase dimerization/phosphoacceptor domain -containing protein [Acetobacteraceae bacterium]